MKIAVLDDYQGVALDLADWSGLAARAEISVFRDHLVDPDAIVARLLPFEVLCVMRERTPLPRELLERLPNLRFIASTGKRNASIDEAATRELGIEVAHTGYASAPTIEMSWAMILAVARNLVGEATAVRNGEWQQKLGVGLHGKTLGLLGLGNVGEGVARIGNAFGMEVIAWSQNLTDADARAKGATLVSKQALFERSDFLSIHVVLSQRSRGLVDAAALASMKPSAFLINMSRGPIVVEEALVDVLRRGAIAGAGLDTFDIDPLPLGHPLRTLANVVATPHIGYVADDLYRVFYSDCVANVTAWLNRQP